MTARSSTHSLTRRGRTQMTPLLMVVARRHSQCQSLPQYVMSVYVQLLQAGAHRHTKQEKDIDLLASTENLR